MCWIIASSSTELWRKPAILYGLAVTNGRPVIVNRIFRLVFGVAYAFSLLAGSGDFLTGKSERFSTCVRLFVFVHKVHTIYVAPAIALIEAHLQHPSPHVFSSPTIVRKSHTALRLMLIASALTSLIVEGMSKTEKLPLFLCRFYLRFSSYAIMDLYLEKGLALLVVLAKLDKDIDGDSDENSIFGGSTAVSERCMTPRYWQIIKMKVCARDGTRWLNQSFGYQLFMFYANTSVNLSCLVGELIILVHQAPGALWSITPRLTECVAAVLLTIFMARLGSDITTVCLRAQCRIKSESGLADELREVLRFRQEWDGLRVIDSAPHELSAIAGAVVNIVTFVAIVLQFDVTVSEAVSASGRCNGYNLSAVAR